MVMPCRGLAGEEFVAFGDQVDLPPNWVLSARGSVTSGPRLGGLLTRGGLRVAETATRCTIVLPGEGGSSVKAHVEEPPDTTAGWRYADPDDCEHDVVNCSIASLTLSAHWRGEATHAAHKPRRGVRAGMRERDHGVPLAPFADG